MDRKVEVKTKKPNGGVEAYKIEDVGIRFDTLENQINIIIDIEEKVSRTALQKFIAAGAIDFNTSFCFKVEVQLNSIGDPVDPDLQKSITISKINC